MAARDAPSPGEQATIQAEDSILLKCLMQSGTETVISYQEFNAQATCTAEKPGTAQLWTYRSSLRNPGQDDPPMNMHSGI